MTYEVILTSLATQQLSKIEKHTAERIAEKLEKIRQDPFHFVKRLQSFDFFSLRVGDYRVIMSIDRGKMVILVIEVGHRKNIYRKF